MSHGPVESLPAFEQTTPREQELLRRAGIRGQVLVDGQLVSVRDQEDLAEVLERRKGGQSEQKARANRATPRPEQAEPGVQEVNPGRLIARLRAQVDAAQFEAAKYGALADELADQVEARDKSIAELEAALEELRAKPGGGEEPPETPDLKAVK